MRAICAWGKGSFVAARFGSCLLLFGWLSLLLRLFFLQVTNIGDRASRDNALLVNMDYLPHLGGSIDHFAWRKISDFQLFAWFIFIFIFLLCFGHLFLSSLSLLNYFYLLNNYRLLNRNFRFIITVFLFRRSFFLFTLARILCPFCDWLIIIRLLQVTLNKPHFISLNLSESEFWGWELAGVILLNHSYCLTAGLMCLSLDLAALRISLHLHNRR